MLPVLFTVAGTPKPPINSTTGLAGNVKTLYLDLYRLLSRILFFLVVNMLEELDSNHKAV